MIVLVIGGHYHCARATVNQWLEMLEPTAVMPDHTEALRNLGAPVYARQWAEAHGTPIMTWGDGAPDIVLDCGERAETVEALRAAGAAICSVTG